jgi:citrate synthase
MFFLKAGRLVRTGRMDPHDALREQILRSMREGERIEGLGHRVHTEDPRRDALWDMAERAKVSGTCTGLSRIVSRVFEEVRGISLPINVDGVIGALVADLGLDPLAAKILFIIGRTAGLAAHHYEEISTQPPMRRIDFKKVDYRGPGDRPFPEGRTS